MLDHRHKTPPVNVLRDRNKYTCGDINGHNIVITCLPLHNIGTLNAAIVVDQLTYSFPNIKVALLVGIGGGIPRAPKPTDPTKDIHLGDVVVGWTSPEAEAVVKWDQGKRLPGGKFQIISRLSPPDRALGNVLSDLYVAHIDGEINFVKHLERCEVSRFPRPDPSEDTLYEADYHHPEGSNDCKSCDSNRKVDRPQRAKRDFEIHFGTIATGDTVMRDALLRDKVRDDCYSAICVEMEAAGVLNRQNCLVIRGISDYADSHKNDCWKPYAAATAASFARVFLYTMDPGVIDEIPDGVTTKSAPDITIQLSQNAILLPDIFTGDLIKIGQLVLNPLVPNLNNYIPSDDIINELRIIEPEPTPTYSRLINLEHDKFSIAKFLNLSSGNRKPNLLEVTAEELRYRTFQNATEALQKICTSQKAKDWIADLALGGKSFYFVFGLLYLQNAQFKRAVSFQSNCQPYSTAPLDRNTQLPLHLRAQLSNSAHASGIFGIELMKAKGRWFKRTGNPSWDDKVHWRWPSQLYKGGGVDDKEFVLELEHVGDIAELEGLLSTQNELPDPDDE
ncbi:hypothetical protein H072_5937 [Dactylellina haptotyla CBS 200.50]|uniref:Uncharacterized protein n=1 Tax=Dactylellina haptotyla (strain CBS 200.50) TaxID=1284197 RepID=S8ABB2_DACHA|nr:hypothetical protein H072_5937 [Dactylellina haptotyla CBS 200.50]